MSREHPDDADRDSGNRVRIGRIHGDMYVVGEGELHIHHNHGTGTVHRTPAAAADVECPYPGLAAFGPEQARWFYGRDRLTGHVLDRVGETLDSGRPLMMVAPSGAGKSSLLRAGVLRRIGEGRLPVAGSARWPHLWLTPTALPLDALAAALAPVLDMDAESVRTMLDTAHDEVRARLRVRVADRRTGSSGRLIVVVDQFEELFSLCSDVVQQRQFVDLLGLLAAVGPDGQPPAGLVLCVLRSDFYTPCAAFPVLREALERNQIFVGAMSSDELRQAILFPAADVGLRVEPGLVDLLLRDLAPTPTTAADNHAGNPNGRAGHEPGRLPLLACALRATWQRCDGSTLTVADYEVTGGIQEAIANTADRVHDGLDRVTQGAVRSVFLRLVRIGDANDGFDDTRRRATHAELANATTDSLAASAVVRSFVQARLLTVERDTVEITHEALLRGWPRLREWIDADRDGNRLRQDIEDTAAAWRQDREDGGLLWRGSRLNAATAWTRTHPTQLTGAGRDFLAAASRARRRARRLRRAAISLLTVLSLVAAVTAAVAFQQRASAVAESRFAAQQRDLAVDREIAAKADALRTADISAAARLDVIAYHRNQTADVRTHLITDASTPLSTILTGHTDSVASVAFSADGEILASGGGDHRIRLWRMTYSGHAKSLGPLPTSGAARVNSVVFSPHGRILASGGGGGGGGGGGDGDGVVRLWNVDDPAHPLLVGHAAAAGARAVNSLAFSGDDRILASGDDDGVVRLWNVANPADPTLLGPPRATGANRVDSVAFSPDGETLASGDNDGNVDLWRVADPAHATLLKKLPTSDAQTVNSVAFSPNGTLLASGSDDDTIQLWNVSDPTHARALEAALTGHPDSVDSVAFNPDGTTLASGGADGSIRLWNVTNPRYADQLGQPLVGHTNSVNSVAFSPDGTTLASGSDDATVRLWTVPGTYLAGHTDSVNSVAFSPNNKLLASGSDDDTVRVWDVSHFGEERPLGPPLVGNTGSVLCVAFSPNGRILAGGTNHGVILLWDVTDPVAPKLVGRAVPTGGHTVESVAFSRDSSVLASGIHDGTIWLWNVSDPAHPKPAGHPLTNYAGSVNSVAFSPHNAMLASANGDDTISLWNVAHPADATPLGRPLAGHTNSVLSVAFSPDGRTLASGGIDGTTRLWDVANPADTHSLGRPLVGHTDSVESVAFSPDGQTLASGSDDSTVLLWNVAQPTHAGPLGQSLVGHTDNVLTVAFSADGKTLASGSADDTILLWSIGIPEDIKRICANTSNFTSLAWQTYIPDITDPPGC